MADSIFAEIRADGPFSTLELALSSVFDRVAECDAKAAYDAYTCAVGLLRAITAAPPEVAEDAVARYLAVICSHFLLSSRGAPGAAVDLQVPAAAPGAPFEAS